MPTVYRIGEIQPNPFRNIERYPIDREKIEKLKGSISRTDFWDNLVARVTPDGVQIAYGHHRMTALREMYPPDHEIKLIIRNLDDASMLHVMADENMQEWQSSGAVIIETVRAVRDFLGAIPISVPARKSGNAAKPNGTADIVSFLGWPLRRVEDALGIINAEERGDLKPEDTADLGIEQATVMRRAVSHLNKNPKLRDKAIARVREGLKEGSIGKRGIEQAVTEAVVGHTTGLFPRNATVPADVARNLYTAIEGYWRTTVRVNGKPVNRSDALRLIAENRNSESLNKSVRPWADQLADALDDMATEATRLAALLRAEQAVAVGA